MEKILPRFEFRAFAQGFGMVEEAVRRLSPLTKYRESLEIYVMSAGNDENNTKIRYGLMDIKVLVKRERGLEQWSPRLKGEFPMAVAMIRDEVFPAFGVAVPELSRDEYTLDQYLEEIIQPHSRLVGVSVFKQRYGFEIHGCMAEIAEVYVNGARLKTVSLESENPDSVLEARERIGLSQYQNVNYLLGIKRVIGMAPLPEQAYYRAF